MTLYIVHPDLTAKIGKIIGAMNSLGFPMRVVQGVRSAEYQHALWLKGRNAAGQVVDAKSIVTNCDGYSLKSNHQIKADGFGHAIDCSFIDDPVTPRDETWLASMPWKVYGEAGKALGLKWGGDFTSPVDLGHLEMP